MRNFSLSCVIALGVACALLTASALLTACSDDPASEPPTPDPIEVTVEGQVADTTGAAIEGVEVAVYPGGSESALDEGATGATQQPLPDRGPYVGKVHTFMVDKLMRRLPCTAA